MHEAAPASGWEEDLAAAVLKQDMTASAAEGGVPARQARRDMPAGGDDSRSAYAPGDYSAWMEASSTGSCSSMDGGVPSSSTPLSSDSRTGVASQARDARSHPPPYRKGASEESGTPKKPDKGADLPHSPQHAHQAPTLPPKAKLGSAGVRLAPSLPPKMQSALMQPAVTFPVQKMIREPRAGGEAQSTYLVGVRSPHEGKAGARGGSDIVSRRLGSEDEADEVESVA